MGQGGLSPPNNNIGGMEPLNVSSLYGRGSVQACGLGKDMKQRLQTTLLAWALKGRRALLVRTPWIRMIAMMRSGRDTNTTESANGNDEMPSTVRWSS